MLHFLFFFFSVSRHILKFFQRPVLGHLEILFWILGLVI